MTLTLLGSAALTLAVGLRAHAYQRRRLLRMVSTLMIATGIGFAMFTSFWPLAIVGLIGTLNPSGGDVSVFLPTEQALLPATVGDDQRTALFARYSLIGTLVAAVGAALAGVPGWIAGWVEISDITALRCAFVAYALLGVSVLARYRHLGPAVERTGAPATRARSVRRSGSCIGSPRCSASTRSEAGSGSPPSSCSGCSDDSGCRSPSAASCSSGQASSPRFPRSSPSGSHAGSASSARWCSRPAAASVTNVPRSLAAALPPTAAGWMLSQTTFGWPLIIGGFIKALYDLLLLAQFREIRPPEER